MSLEFTNMNIEGQQGVCSPGDRVEVYDGQDSTARLFGNYCGVVSSARLFGNYLFCNQILKNLSNRMWFFHSTQCTAMVRWLSWT